MVNSYLAVKEKCKWHSILRKNIKSSICQRINVTVILGLGKAFHMLEKIVPIQNILVRKQKIANTSNWQ